MKELVLTNPFWNFSIKVWQNQGLQKRLMELQEEYDLDINLTLFAIWISGRALDVNEYAQSVKDMCLHWQSNFIRPIREMRRNCASERGVKALKSQLMKAELSAEQHQQANLFEFAQQLSSSSKDLTTTLRDNLDILTSVNWSKEDVALFEALLD